MVNDVRKRLTDRNISLDLTQAAKERLVKQGYDPVFGARPLRRLITREVENELSKRILAGEFKEGDSVLMDVRGDEYVFTRKEQVTAAAS
jgi:ATP-dependent Clp protease ATP-binding subunit ClpA